MSDERWKAILSFVQFILGTVIVGVFGTIINNRIQTREIEIKEQEQIFKNLSTVLSEKTWEKVLMAQFYSTVTRSEEIRKGWAAYRNLLQEEIAEKKAAVAQLEKEINKSTDVDVIEQKQTAIQNITAQITPKSSQSSAVPSSARVYFHIQNEAQRARLSGIADALGKNSGIAVPGIELVRSAPSASQLRYFRVVDAAEANAIADLLEADGVAAKPTYIPGHEASRSIRPRHFELWLAQAWK